MSEHSSSGGCASKEMLSWVAFRLLEEVLRHISTAREDGAILVPSELLRIECDWRLLQVFLPGVAEISTLFDRLMGTEFNNKSQYLVMPLHGLLGTVRIKA